jgi:uncharacterized protein YndB with AHSA1/START domain
MTTRSITHATFALERTYPARPGDVFAAWAEPAKKAAWFATPGATHQLDFRVGGEEVTSGTMPDGRPVTFISRYYDIVPGERIAYSSRFLLDEELTTISQATIEIAADGDGTRLRLVEQGAYLDGHEQPSWREQGTGEQLDALGRALATITTG